jgi:hypothetical protein
MAKSQKNPSSNYLSTLLETVGVHYNSILQLML